MIKGNYCCRKDTPSECPIGATNPLQALESDEQVSWKSNIFIIFKYFKVCVKYERSIEDAEMARTNFKVIQDDNGKVTMKWQKPEVNDAYNMGDIP